MDISKALKNLPRKYVDSPLELATSEFTAYLKENHLKSEPGVVIGNWRVIGQNIYYSHINDTTTIAWRY